MKKLATFAIALAILATACSKKPQTIRVVMKNDTGQHMTNFVLDYGEGTIKYQIFSKDYTFAEEIPVTSIHQMKVEFYDDAGAKVSYDLDKPISPDMLGGSLRIDFKPEGKHFMSVEFPEE